MVHDIWYRLRSLVRRNAAEVELSEELQNHLEPEAAKYRNSGMDDVAAMRLARARFGGDTQVRGYGLQRGTGPPRTKAFFRTDYAPHRGAAWRGLNQRGDFSALCRNPSGDGLLNRRAAGAPPRSEPRDRGSGGPSWLFRSGPDPHPA